MLEISHPYDIGFCVFEMKVNVTYISCLSDFILYLEDYLIDECHTWDNGSVRHKD